MQGVRDGGVRSVFALAVLAFVLAGCSSVPDAANPVEWYKGVESWFDDDDARAKPEPAKPVPGADKPYPNLANVGDRPEARPAEEQRKVAKGLVSDRENARYADETLRKSTPAAPPPSGASSGSAPRAVIAPPPPRPVPRVPVQGAALQPSPSRSGTATPATAVPATATPATTAPATATPATAAPATTSGSEVQRVYSERMRQSAATVTTAPVGPTVQPSRSSGPVRAEARPLSASEAPAQTASAPSGPRPLREFDALRKGISYRVAVIRHGRGSAGLSKKAMAQLRQVASLHKQNGGTLRIVGHASSLTRDMNLVRHRMLNFKLSMDRANVTAKRLAELGVDPKAMFVGAVSDSQPVYYEVMPAGEAANRRTEIYIDQ